MVDTPEGTGRDGDHPDARTPDEAREGGRQAPREAGEPERGHSVVQQVGARTGSAPSISLREVDPAVQAPMLKPLGSEAARMAGKYMVQGLLGEGGVGAVHQGHDTDLGREVAMKFLHDRFQDEPAVLHRFVEEAQIGGQLQHPGIVPVYELGMSEGRPFFTMKLVRGQTLAKALAERPSPDSDRRTFLTIFEDICQTMAYAHARGVVHRDLKPANVMIGSYGEVQVVDWGMGKVLQPGHGADEQPAHEDQPQADAIETVRSLGHGTQSVMGSVMGTLAYMPPEQARGAVDQMDERSDVFALGAILCEILTGLPPYAGEPRALFDMATRADLGEAHARLRACGAEPELVELATRCLAPSPEARPRSAAQVADTVHAHLSAAEQRAHEATVRALALKRTQKFGVALTVVIALGLAASLWFWRGARDAAASEREARGVAEQATQDAQSAESLARDAQQRAETSLANFDRLSYVVRLETARAAELELHPAWPHMAPRLRAWLGGEAAELRDALPELRATVASLAARAAPWTEAQRVAAPSLHPRAGELAFLRGKLDALQRAHAVRSGAAGYEPVALDTDRYPQDANGLNALAWPLVDPARETFGREAEALAMSLRAFATTRQPALADTLAWALFANGLDDEALAVSESALDTVDAGRRAEYQGYLDTLRGAIAEASSERGRAALDALAAQVAALETAVGERVEWEFEDEADEFLHATLSALVADIEAFEALEVRGAERRLAWAERVEGLTVEAHRERWEAARRAIRAADGTTASELYAAVPIDLQPQVGLVPIGMNPVTKLWEFYHLRSAWDADAGGDAAQLPIPAHAPDGSLDMAGRGVVFVLIPGGRFWMGAQGRDPRGANHDGFATPLEGPVRELELAPYFLSRYELTRGQWMRLTGGMDPSFNELGRRSNDAIGFVGETHPVEQVGHEACTRVLTQHGLVLPTEAQWEYGCRAGSSTPWFTGPARQSLEGFVNLLDWTGTNQPPKWPGGESFDDHSKASAPVGTYRPNAFGLHDVHGNVVEWCRDRHASYEVTPRAGDGLRDPGPASRNHVFRGGCYLNNAQDVRSSVRSPDAPPSRFAILGVRPARPLNP